MKKLIIAGAGGSGKDYFADFLKSKNLLKTKEFTTRPKRDENDNTYYFVDSIPEDECYSTFDVNGRDWKYGYSKKEIIEKDFTIIPPSVIFNAIDFLSKERVPLYIVYFDIDENVRRERMSKRNDTDVERRLRTDYEDFFDFDFFFSPNLTITDPYFNCEEIYEKIRLQLL